MKITLKCSSTSVCYTQFILNLAAQEYTNSRENFTCLEIISALKKKHFRLVLQIFLIATGKEFNKLEENGEKALDPYFFRLW